jgi:hypothetical protein
MHQLQVVLLLPVHHKQISVSHILSASVHNQQLGYCILAEQSFALLLLTYIEFALVVFALLEYWTLQAVVQMFELFLPLFFLV